MQPNLGIVSTGGGRRHGKQATTMRSGVQRGDPGDVGCLANRPRVLDRHTGVSRQRRYVTTGFITFLTPAGGQDDSDEMLVTREQGMQWRHGSGTAHTEEDDPGPVRGGVD